MHTHILFILSLVLLWFNATTATSVGHQLVAAAANTCIDKERQALLDFKAQLQDPEDCLSTWGPDEEDDCCQWRGVGCSNRTGHVTDLDLFNDGIVGEISFSLLNLSYLNYLVLSSNSFHGNILEFIGSMTHLTYLDLGYNQFSGSIPKSIGHLTQLTFLSLDNNQFTGTIPESIFNMTQLTYLNLGLNQFTGTIHSSIGSLTNLTELWLGGNDFTGIIPESIRNMTKLTELYLYGNNFSGTIPRSIGYLTKLTALSLSGNSLYGTIPPEFGNLTNLEQLSLGNLRSCTVENLDWLSSFSYLGELFMDGTSLAKVNNWVNVIIGLKNLGDLRLSGCDLSQVMHPYSPSVNSSSSVHTLYLDNNNLNSSMFRWLCTLFGKKLIDLSLSRNKFDEKLSGFLNFLSRCASATTLIYLDASSNQFTGSLSNEIQHFSSLIGLYLSSNQLDGTLSDKLWELPNLQLLDLSSNSLRGAISKSIGKSNLWHIDLSNNSLEGAPSDDDVSNLSMTVGYIDFSSNKLGPHFPKWMHKFKNLFHLDLSKTSISDTVSTEQWNQWQSSQLIYLDLSFNNISGKLPESLSNHDLDFIDLSFNIFYGPIPAFQARMSFLDLSRNKFHGGISFLCQIYENFEFLDISRNSLTGKVPDCFQNLTYLRVLNLGHNTLSGSIPPSIGCLVQLETLSLYNNNFSGELPLSLKNCTMLSLLDLGANKLYGNIPVWIGESLSKLYALSLKSNNFFGTIPSQICQLVSLQILDLSFNNLHGTIPSCVNNLTSLVHKGLFLDQSVHHYRGVLNVTTSYIDRVMIEWQGKVNEFSSNLGFMKSIDLSSNSLTGQIPYEITDLQGLVVLNLSHNTLFGEIPINIGQMKELQTLDLSKNNLSGGLPSSLSQLNFLSILDVSHNNLSGRIPSGTQLQTFEPARYIGNAGLCGSPLPKKCPGEEELDEPHTIHSQGDEEGIERWFYIGGASGFATGFWIVCSTILLNRRMRHAFFQFYYSLKDWVYVKVVVFIAKWRRVARA
ncbi:leucine-rich repeat-containing protein [Tanacetum coccineum]